MKKTVLTFGLISGAIISVLMIVDVPFIDQIGFDRGDDHRLHHDGAGLFISVLWHPIVPRKRR